jgi:hypothetical protein
MPKNQTTPPIHMPSLLCTTKRANTNTWEEKYSNEFLRWNEFLPEISCTVVKTVTRGIMKQRDSDADDGLECTILAKNTIKSNLKQQTG